jgi:hypothetical protein
VGACALLGSHKDPVMLLAVVFVVCVVVCDVKLLSLYHLMVGRK